MIIYFKHENEIKSKYRKNKFLSKLSKCVFVFAFIAINSASVFLPVTGFDLKVTQISKVVACESMDSSEETFHSVDQQYKKQ